MPFTTVAAGIWGALLCLLGYLFWGSVDELLALIGRGSLGLAIAAVVTVGAVALHRQRRAAAQR